MRVLPKLFAAMVLGAVAVAVPALAQPSADKLTTYPSCAGRSPKPDEGNAAYLLGKKRYDARDFDKALELFMEAYNYDCGKHDYLIIISRTHELMAAKGETVRHLKEAHHALEVYYERMKQEPDDDGKTRLNALKADIRAAEQKAAAAASASASASSTSTAPPPKTDGGHTPWPWIPVGIGGASIVTGAILVPVGLLALPEGCSFSTGKCTPQPNDLNGAVRKERTEEAGNAKGKVLFGFGFIGGGIVAVAGGLIWHFLEPTDASPSASTSRRDKPMIVPTIGSGFAGVNVGGRF